MVYYAETVSWILNRKILSMPSERALKMLSFSAYGHVGHERAILRALEQNNGGTARGRNS